MNTNTKRKPASGLVVIGDDCEDAMWAQFHREQNKATPPDRPPGRGWLTIAEYADKHGMSPHGASYRVKRWEQAGVIETHQGRGPRNMPTLYFRPKIQAR